MPWPASRAQQMRPRGPRSSGKSTGANCRRCGISRCECPRRAPDSRPGRRGPLPGLHAHLFRSCSAAGTLSGGRGGGRGEAVCLAVDPLSCCLPPLPQRLRDPDRAQPFGHEGALFERVQLPRPLLQSECRLPAWGWCLRGGAGSRGQGRSLAWPGLPGASTGWSLGGRCLSLAWCGRRPASGLAFVDTSPALAGDKPPEPTSQLRGTTLLGPLCPGGRVPGDGGQGSKPVPQTPPPASLALRRTVWG